MRKTILQYEYCKTMQTAYLLLNVSKIDKYLQLQESSSFSKVHVSSGVPNTQKQIYDIHTHRYFG